MFRKTGQVTVELRVILYGPSNTFWVKRLTQANAMKLCRRHTRHFYDLSSSYFLVSLLLFFLLSFSLSPYLSLYLFLLLSFVLSFLFHPIFLFLTLDRNLRDGLTHNALGTISFDADFQIGSFFFPLPESWWDPASPKQFQDLRRII